MALAMVLRGRTHRLQATAPPPFLGPGHVFGRSLAEQWINFPRFVPAAVGKRHHDATHMPAAPQQMGLEVRAPERVTGYVVIGNPSSPHHRSSNRISVASDSDRRWADYRQRLS
jgi:hypothetical protein